MSFIREPDAEPIKGYRLIEPIGSGGFGEVWKCEAPGGLFKAIKFVFGNLNSLDVEGARAEQELHALNRVKEVRHPFVLSMDRIEVVEGELVIVMELADKSLHDSLVESQHAGLVGIPRDTLLRYLRDAAEALDHMNEKHNLQHLDIKPRNLFLISDRVKVADFGLVKHLERASASGILGGVTPLYAPPETFQGKISPATDQYSLAIVYQELLTGQRPFNGKNARALAQQHLQEDPDLRALPEAERSVVLRALAKDPKKRFPSCLEFIRALYTARTPTRAEVVLPDGAAARPKTMADMLEDIPLGIAQAPAAPEESDGWVSLPDVGPEEPDEGSKLGVTQAQPQTGSLRPTLLIGIGSFGRRALLELRCRFIDRFGGLDKLPLLRFLYVDPDVDALKAGTRGNGEVTFQAGETYHLPLQQVGHYRKRQMEQLADWLPREKLYALPRSLKTQGSRALGRLAFADNYLRLITRLKREIQQCCHPDALYQSVTQTGLALRDNLPRVYVIASAGGGGSGFLVDLGYALRRLLHQMRHNDAPVTALLGCSAPDDPATPRSEQANVYATLTEINHFTDPSIPFTAQYGTDGPRLVDEGAPFDAAYLLPAAHRSPEATQAVVAHLGSFLFHELTTPLGLRLDQVRRPDAGRYGTTPFRGLGTYAVWFPRGLLLRLAARSACLRLLEEWCAGGEAEARPPRSENGLRDFTNLVPRGSSPEMTLTVDVRAACAKVLADPQLRPEAVISRIEQLAGTLLAEPPAEALTRLLALLEEQSQQSVALDDPGNWARQALTRVREWLGAGVATAPPNGQREPGDWRKSKLSRSLEQATAQVAQEWEVKLLAAVRQVMDLPGRRVAAAEAALGMLVEASAEACAAHEGRKEQYVARVQQAQGQLQAALDRCVAGGGGFSFFGGGPRRHLRVFMDHLAAFARQCLAEDLASSVFQFHAVLGGRLRDRLREMSFVRQRLRGIQEQLEEPPPSWDEPVVPPAAGSDLTPMSSATPTTETFWEAIRQSPTTRVVLPLAEKDLERAAGRVLGTLTTEQWAQLDQALQERVLGPNGGLYQALNGAVDLSRHLLGPLLTAAAGYLGELLPTTDVAQVLLDGPGPGGGEETLAEQARDYFTSAAPLIDRAGARLQAAPAAKAAMDATAWKPEVAVSASEHAYLLIPASDAGRAYGEQMQKVLPQLHVVRVPGQAALMFCREQGWVTLEDLQQVLAPCRRAYEELAVAPVNSPHSRTDIVDWIPLDP
jgi:hypothetical protein